MIARQRQYDPDEAGTHHVYRVDVSLAGARGGSLDKSRSNVTTGEYRFDAVLDRSVARCSRPMPILVIFLNETSPPSVS